MGVAGYANCVVPVLTLLSLQMIGFFRDVSIAPILTLRGKLLNDRSLLLSFTRGNSLWVVLFILKRSGNLLFVGGQLVWSIGISWLDAQTLGLDGYLVAVDH